MDISTSGDDKVKIAKNLVSNKQKIIEFSSNHPRLKFFAHDFMFEKEVIYWRMIPPVENRLKIGENSLHIQNWLDAKHV